jgi:hypothetical protein
MFLGVKAHYNPGTVVQLSMLPKLLRMFEGEGAIVIRYAPESKPPAWLVQLE